MIVENNWNIRKATLDDSVNLQNCMESAYSSYQDRLSGIVLPPMVTDYSNEIAGYPTWVAEIKEDVVGGLIMTFGKDYAAISNVAVHPQSQGLGLGRGLLDFAQNEAKTRGYSQLRLATHVLLTENISLYEHLGWRVTGKDDVRVYMEKEI